MALFVPLDGRITSQNVLPIPITDLSAAMEIVSPGNAATGNTYQTTLAALAALFSAFPALNTEIITAGSTYNVLTTDTRILVNKTIGSATSIVFPLSGSMIYSQPVLVKDIKGDANVNHITITFSGGQKCDNLSSVVINASYGWTWINPIPGGAGWYMT